VIDERSARSLDLTAADSNIFDVSGKFTSTSNYTADLRTGSSSGVKSLEETLITKKVDYRIFTSNVAIRGAKWSREDVFAQP
jgi:hypothetical protein